jgi:hypothetical protein
MIIYTNQGAIIVLAGALAILWLPELFDVRPVFRPDFQILVAGHCILLGGFFVGRMFNHVLLAHQRYDAMNYGQIGGLVVNLGLIWLGFAAGWKLYSLLVWLRSPFLCLLSMTAVFGALGWGDAGWNHLPRLMTNTSAASLVGLALFWQLGLTPQLRDEASGLLARLRGRLRPMASDESGG